ncbi:S8 family peptidase [Actinophytocola sediminis]
MLARDFLRRSGALLGVLAVTATGVLTGAVAAPPAAAAPSTAAPRPTTTAVTLITGDTVTLTERADGQPAVSVRQAAGTRAVTTLRQGDDVYVVPDQVEHLVPEVLDLELFNVTGLVEMGYADAATDTLPVIVRGAQPFASTAGTRPLPSIGATAVSVPKGTTLARTRIAGTTKVWLDRKFAMSELDWNLTAIGAQEVWDTGLSGAGVDVAVLDTGVDRDHPDLAGQVAAEVDLTGGGSPADGNGHGTHVASIIAGTGAAAAGARQGVAAKSRLLSAKVLDAEGLGQASWVIAGMEWATSQGADIVNLSLGARTTTGDDPVTMALDALSESTDTLFVVAAGNSGPGQLSIETPGSAPSALTVGATDAAGRVARFSSWGPTNGTYRPKPDIAAPGAEITGAAPGGGYAQLSGTSQATPHVAGAAALLREQHPDWDGERIKAALMSTADGTWTGRPSTEQQGAGLLNLPDATSETLLLDTPSVDFGYLRYPQGQEPRDTEITLTNTGTTEESVTATDLVYHASDAAAPDDLITISPDRLDIAPGASATFTVTVTPRNAEPGRYVGAVTLARAGQDPMTLPVAFYAEAPRADLRLTVLDRRGEPVAGGTVWLGNIEKIHPETGGGFTIVQLDEHGRGTGRLVPGAVSVLTVIETPAAGGSPATVALAGSPEVRLDADLDYTIDARKAKVLKPATVTGKSTRVAAAGVHYAHHDQANTGSLGTGFPVTREEIEQGRVFVQPTRRVTQGRVALHTQWELDGTGRDQGELFELLLGKDVVPDPPAYQVSTKDLARLDTNYHTAGPGEQSYREDWWPAQELYGGFTFSRAATAPRQRVEWVSARPDVAWSHCLFGPRALVSMCTPPASYAARSRQSPVWFRALTPTMFQGQHDRNRMELLVGLTDGTHRGHPRDPAVMGEASLRLFRDGVEQSPVVPSTGWFDISSPDQANFRLEHRATPSRDHLRLGGQVDTTWTFPSAAPTDPTKWTSTPTLLALDYDPPTDTAGRLPARVPLLMPMRLMSNPNTLTPIRTERGGLNLWTSTDQGRHWQRAIVLPQRDGTFLTMALISPRSGQAVSVRAEGAGAEGRTVSQTIIDAYPVR